MSPRLTPIVRKNNEDFEKTWVEWKSYGYEVNGINALDPLFVSIANRDFRLQLGSPVIDAGTDLSAYFTTNKDGTTRPQGSAWDIGAYEYIP